MKKYELMYILRPTLSEEELKTEKENVVKILTSNGAKIGNSQDWGLKDFAYPIEKESKGYYVIINFETENQQTVSEFNRLVRLKNNVLRFLITKA